MAIDEDQKTILTWLKHEIQKGGKAMMVLSDDEKAARPLSVDEAAEYLGIHNKTLTKWIREGRIKAVKLGRDWRISRAEITRIEAEGIEGPQAAKPE